MSDKTGTGTLASLSPESTSQKLCDCCAGQSNLEALWASRPERGEWKLSNLQLFWGMPQDCFLEKK